VVALEHPHRTVIEMIGGNTPQAVGVGRKPPRSKENLAIAANYVPGDVVFVPERLF